MTNKREFNRIPENLQILYTISSSVESPDPGSLEKKARMENISEGGMLFESNELVPIGSILSIEIRPKEEGAFNITGKVVRLEEFEDRKKFEIGVMFVHYSESETKSIIDYIQRLIAKT